MNKRIDGIWNSAPHKRYKTFIVTSADQEQVFVHKGDKWSVWPEEVFALRNFPNNVIECLDVHEFCEELSKEGHCVQNISVFPTEVNTTMVEADILLRDLLEELGRIE